MTDEALPLTASAIESMRLQDLIKRQSFTKIKRHLYIKNGIFSPLLCSDPRFWHNINGISGKAFGATNSILLAIAMFEKNYSENVWIVEMVFNRMWYLPWMVRLIKGG